MVDGGLLRGLRMCRIESIQIQPNRTLDQTLFLSVYADLFHSQRATENIGVDLAICRLSLELTPLFISSALIIIHLQLI